MRHKLIWHGHSNFVLKTQNTVIAIDPFFEGNPTAQATPEDIGEIDLVLVTHDHQDHIGQALSICKNTGASLLAIVETVSKLVDAGLPQSQVINGIGINIGGSVEFRGISIKMVQAVHSSESGLPVGYIITLPDGYCLYHSGDTGIFATMELFGKFHSIDLAMLPIGGTFTMDPHQAAVACQLLRCKKVIGMHWGTFPVLEQDTTAFGSSLETLGVETTLVDLSPSDTIILEKDSDDDCRCF
ncbi:metal-dependent hydrolase [Desulfovibrio inopinatus]|uniref:metal-dependent hydrolase n=1 Tax=Desulfovibrio inopinatus TaxID=102109 RepID=UPI0004135C63|nr:metal-dependent hydrolase [Desulfovibrio inopinatus]